MVGFTGGGQTNSAASCSSSLKPLAQRSATGRPGDRAAAPQARAGARRDAVPAGGAGHPHRRPRRATRSTSTRCRPTTWRALRPGRRKLAEALQQRAGAHRRQFRPAGQGPGDRSRRSTATPPRAWASPPSQIDNTLYDAFGQRQVSTIYNPLNQYHVVMEVAPQLLAEPGDAERHLCQHLRRRGRRHPSDQCGRPAPSRRSDQRRRRSTAAQRSPRDTGHATRHRTAGQQSATARLDRRGGQHRAPRPWCRWPRSRSYGPGKTPLAVNHQGPFVATHDLVQPGARANR